MQGRAPRTLIGALSVFSKSRQYRWLTTFAFLLGLAGSPGIASAGPLIVPMHDSGGSAAHYAWALQGTPAAEPDSSVVVSGSATVGPILEAAAEAFAVESPNVDVTIDETSSGAGFEVLGTGESDIGTSGRQINPEEAEACAAAGVDYDEFEVAFDGVVVVVNTAIDFVDCLTVEQLGQLWEPDSTVSTWQELDPAWPAEPIELYGTGEASGAYQFFTQMVVGEEGPSRDDYTVTEGHLATAEGVIADASGLGFLPLPRYLEVQDQVTLVAVDGGEGCVGPSAGTIQEGAYAPLSRALYVYVNQASLARSEVAAFLQGYFADAGGYAESAGLVASSDSVYDANLAELDDAISDAATPDCAATPPS